MILDNFTIKSNGTILEALSKIEFNNNGFLVVLDVEDKVYGTLTDGDIRRALLKGYLLDSILENICNKKYKYVTLDTSFEEIVEKFKSPAIAFLPVVDRENRLHNIITKRQFHVFLMEDLPFDITYNFFTLDIGVIDQEIHSRPWGFYKTSFLNSHARAKIIKVVPDGVLSLQEHKRRDEHWIIIKGTGKLTIGEATRKVQAGDYVFIPRGCKHRIQNLSRKDTLLISEVQLGDYFGEDDIIRYADVYGRE